MVKSISIITGILLFAGVAAADTLVVRGNVRAEGGSALPGAVVLIALPGGSVLDTVTADDQGAFSATVQNTRRVVILVASDSGYSTERFYGAVASPKDAATDTITNEFELALFEGTTIVTGVVVDSSTGQPVANALAVAVSGSLTQGLSNDSALTDAQGAFTISIEQQAALLLYVTVENTGYRTKQVNVPRLQDTIALDTVRLAALTAGDTLAYTIAGRLTTSTGAGVGQASVVIAVRRADSLVYTDTTTTGGNGRFEFDTALGFSPGALTVTLTATKENFQDFDTTIASSAGTENIVVNGVMQEVTGVIGSMPRKQIPAGKLEVVLFTLDGRMIARSIASAATLDREVSALLKKSPSQGVVVRIMSGGKHVAGLNRLHSR